MSSFSVTTISPRLWTSSQVLRSRFTTGIRSDSHFKSSILARTSIIGRLSLINAAMGPSAGDRSIRDGIARLGSLPGLTMSPRWQDPTLLNLACSLITTRLVSSPCGMTVPSCNSAQARPIPATPTSTCRMCSSAISLRLNRPTTFSLGRFGSIRWKLLVRTLGK